MNLSSNKFSRNIPSELTTLRELTVVSNLVVAFAWKCGSRGHNKFQYVLRMCYLNFFPFLSIIHYWDAIEYTFGFVNWMLFSLALQETHLCTMLGLFPTPKHSPMPEHLHLVLNYRFYLCLLAPSSSTLSFFCMDPNLKFSNLGCVWLWKIVFIFL